MKTAKDALATYLSWDISELTAYNYHYGHYTKSIYNVCDGLYVAVRSEKDLPKPTRKGINEIKWVEVKDDFVNKYNWLIFKAQEEE